jgi:hypothetical protein
MPNNEYTWKLVERQLANAMVRRLGHRVEDRDREQIVDAHKRAQDAQLELRRVTDEIIDQVLERR